MSAATTTNCCGTSLPATSVSCVFFLVFQQGRGAQEDSVYCSGRLSHIAVRRGRNMSHTGSLISLDGHCIMVIVWYAYSPREVRERERGSRMAGVST
jgi:hypothetical protein